MARLGQRTTKTAKKVTGFAGYVRLENRLTLLAWLNGLLGYWQNKDLLEDAKNTAEGFDASGRSFLYYHLIGRGSQVGIPSADLERYDENIYNHLAVMNRGRTAPITLRYFQYLAALYVEIFLDRYFNHRARFLVELNTFVRERNAGKLPGELVDEEFSEHDLTKLAFWMATGERVIIVMGAVNVMKPRVSGTLNKYILCIA